MRYRSIRQTENTFKTPPAFVGQSPEVFESTFLSLSSGNKKDIPFVQGKYNMGSSGVLGYWGLKWYKLILSRRHDGSG